MKQEKRLPALLQEKNLNGSKGYSPLVPEQKSDVKKEITQLSKDVKELVKETKKGTKALTSVEKILKKSSEERQDTKKELNVEKKQEQLATPIVKSTQGIKEQASQSREESNKEEKNSAQLELDFGADGKPSSKPSGRSAGRSLLSRLGPGAAVAGAAGVLGGLTYLGMRKDSQLPETGVEAAERGVALSKENQIFGENPRGLAQVLDEQEAKNKPLQIEAANTGPPRQLFEQKRAEVNQAADYKSAGDTMEAAGYSTVTGRGAMKPGDKEMQPADFEQAQQAQAAREAVQRGLQQRRRGGTGRGDVPVPPRPDTVEPPIEAQLPSSNQAPIIPTDTGQPPVEAAPKNSIVARIKEKEAEVQKTNKQVRDAASELGLDPNKVKGKFEAGELVAIIDEDGKLYDVTNRLSAEQRKKVDMIRKLRAGEEPEQVENADFSRGYAAGGLVISPNEEKTSNKYGTGGLIKGPGGDKTDSIAAYNKDSGRPIALSNNEYIIPADVTKEVGKGVLDAIVQDPNVLKRATGGFAGMSIEDAKKYGEDLEKELQGLSPKEATKRVAQVVTKLADEMQPLILEASRGAKKLLEGYKDPEVLAELRSSKEYAQLSEKERSDFEETIKPEKIDAQLAKLDESIKSVEASMMKVQDFKASARGQELLSESAQNKELSTEMSSGGAIQPIVIQNNNSMSTQTAIPIKAEPRMQSSFTRFNDSRSAY